MPLTPDHASILLKAELRALRAESPVTRSVIAAIPPDKGDFKPEAVAKSAFELAWHLVSAEHNFMKAAAEGSFEPAGSQRPESIRTSADIVEWYVANFARDAERLDQVSGEQLLASLDFRGIVKMSALAFVQLAHSHSIHHRGQLSMYLRPMGAKVPSIYGESFDSKQARLQAVPKP